MRLGYYLGRATKGVAKATLPVAKWATQQATTFALEFSQGMTEKPVSITDKNYRDENIDNEIKQELSSEPVQPELPLEHPQQPVRES
jgi:hypothetical protein